MDKLVVKYWLPLLLIALGVALFSEFRSVERVDLARSDSEPSALATPPPQAAPRTALTRDAEPLRTASRSRLAAGQRYDSLDELVRDQLAEGFVRTGYFGKHWPATVTEIATDRHKISFVRQNGTRHSYTKFAGYDMKMVRLRAGGEETIVVFRSAKKSYR